MAILLTGVTGALGGELLRRLLELRPDSIIYTLYRANSPLDAQVGSLFIHSLVARRDVDRVIPIPGNVEFGDLGLAERYSELIDTVTEIFHVAACTNFGQSEDQARRVNVLGTEHIIDFAREIHAAGNTIRLHYISTAYVSGTRIGFLREDELEEGQEFFNYYEWSKFEAERAIRTASADIPTTVFRPGIIVGDSRSGCTSKFQGIYQVMKGIHVGLITSIPARPDFQLDLSPVDYVCTAIVQLASLQETTNRSFHLTAGPGNTVPLGELIDIYFRERVISGGSCLSRVFKFCSADEADPTPFNQSSAISDLFTQYSPYFTCPKIFSNSMTSAALSHLKIPPFREYLPRAIRYALETGFRSESVDSPYNRPQSTR